MQGTTKSPMKLLSVGLSLVAVALPITWLSCNSSSTLSDNTSKKDSSTIITKVGAISMVRVPAGTYMEGTATMIPGTERDSSHYRSLELPQRQVNITKPMYVSIYEITEAQWKAVMGDTTTIQTGLNYPKTNLRWYDMIYFCNTLSVKEGLKPYYEVAGTEQENGKNVSRDTTSPGYRLLTSAEWEYAYRAGTTSDYYNGNLIFYDDRPTNLHLDSNCDKIAWNQNNSGDHMHPVGQKLPNAWGLYDMAGNGMEPCFDYGRRPAESGSCTDPVFWLSGGEEMERAARGGCYGTSNMTCRGAARLNSVPAMTRTRVLVLRLARTIP